MIKIQKELELLRAEIKILHASINDLRYEVDNLSSIAADLKKFLIKVRA